jgi:hypothetical protein
MLRVEEKMVLAFLKSVILNMRHLVVCLGEWITLDLTGNSQKHRGTRQMTSPKVKKNSGQRIFLGCPDFFLSSQQKLV